MSRALLKFIKSVCVQPAWYWANSTGTPDGFGGVTYTPPVLVYVRWDGVTQLVIDSTGKEVVSSGELLVTEKMAMGGRLKLADVDSLDTKPATPAGSSAILRVSTTPMFRSATMFTYTVYV